MRVYKPTRGRPRAETMPNAATTHMLVPPLGPWSAKPRASVVSRREEKAGGGILARDGTIRARQTEPAARSCPPKCKEKHALAEENEEDTDELWRFESKGEPQVKRTPP